MWGDAPKDVISFLRAHGIDAAEAKSIVDGIFNERAATVRAEGIRKIFTGIGLMLVPVITVIVFLSVGYMPVKIVGFTVMIGCYGFYLLVKGLFMVLAPKSESGDVADH